MYIYHLQTGDDSFLPYLPSLSLTFTKRDHPHLIEMNNKMQLCRTIYYSRKIFFFFFQALNFLVESFGLHNDLFPFPSILDAGYPGFYFRLADVLIDVILPSVLGCSL
jgi:hypothetical protein